MIPSAVQLLRQLKEKQYALKRELGAGYEDNNLLFCYFTGKPIWSSGITRRFHSVAKEADIEGTHIHCLRHTFATRGLENGIELKVMQELLGHSSIAMTANVYSHVLPNKKKEAIMKLDGTITI